MENELIREKSRGLSGGTFMLSTLLNRKDVRTKKGKEAVDAFEDFIKLKSDAMFCTSFLHMHQLDENKDNTPKHLQASSADDKLKYIYGLVAKTLRDLIPEFAETDTGMPLINDFPLQAGRYEQGAEGKPTQKANEDTPPVSPIVNVRSKEASESNVKEFMVTSFKPKKKYSCSICSSTYKLQAVCITHIENCMKRRFSPSNLPISQLKDSPEVNNEETSQESYRSLLN